MTAAQADGYALAAAGRLEEASVWFERARRLHPSDLALQYAEAIVMLARGRYAAGLPGYELRHHFGGAPLPQVPWPQWRGESLAGRRLVIFPEQGLGDAIQFARFAPQLADAGAHVTLLCRPPLVRLFSGLGVRVVAAAGNATFPDPDYWVRANSLLRCVGETAENLSGTPYLSAPAVRTGGVGVMARGNPGHHNDVNRSLTPDLAQILLDLPGAVDLRPEATGAADLFETAKIVAGLDLVISVDTAVAHLAGALGVRTWTLLPAHNTDWRWMRERADTPWYRSMRLFRQRRIGDWGHVVRQILVEHTSPRDLVRRMPD